MYCLCFPLFQQGCTPPPMLIWDSSYYELLCGNVTAGVQSQLGSCSSMREVENGGNLVSLLPFLPGCEASISHLPGGQAGQVMNSSQQDMSLSSCAPSRSGLKTSSPFSPQSLPDWFQTTRKGPYGRHGSHHDSMDKGHLSELSLTMIPQPK